MQFLKILFITVVLLHFCIFTVYGAEIKSERFVYKSSDKKFSITIIYPQVSGLEDKNVEKEVNKFLKKGFLTGYEGVYGRSVNFLDKKDLEFCHKDLIENFGNNSTYNIEVEYNIGVNKNNILSIHYTGLAMLTPSAHPSKLLKTFTVNLKDGKIYTFKDLFKEKSNYMSLMEKLIKKHDLYIEKQKESYDFYLTTDELILININTSYAIQGFEGNIKFQEIKDIINEKGPIGILMK
ncbi:MAG: hypothetical protein BWY64_00531 [bacterium ADurb.Bin363]|nr:MAG: hypothetical protein BWY64_00531 [bacterium ADurb.Bin363]